MEGSTGNSRSRTATRARPSGKSRASPTSRSLIHRATETSGLGGDAGDLGARGDAGGGPPVSEYQCYEFVALDRPLTARQMAELRAISTRAEISPTRFWNEYQWGDLKGDPAKLVARYFDAHLYFANWGTHRLMLRLPKARVDTKALKQYFAGHSVRLTSTGEHVVLDL